METVYMVAGGLAIGLNVIAGLAGGMAWARHSPSTVFWSLLRAAQALTAVFVLVETVLYVSGARADYGLHYLYGFLPLVAMFLAEGTRAAAGRQELGERDLASLNDEQKTRLTLLQQDVLEVREPQADCILALNFSYSVFHTRSALGAYVRNCFASLKPGGMLFADAWGGPDVLKRKVDKTKKGGFTYEWDQHKYDPISHRIECRIHFSFPDGTRKNSAFVYDWRLWTLAELRELFADAGFEDVHVLWEGTDHATGGGNGVFKRKEVGDMDEAWIAIVVGRKPEASGGKSRAGNASPKRDGKRK